MDQTDLEALLATLRQAQDGSTPAPAPAAASSAPAPPPSSASAPPPQAQLDALLSSLTALPPAPAEPPAPPPTRTRDLSAVSFAESVPILNGLALDPSFLERVQAIWDDQETFELRTKDERNRLELELVRSAASPILKSSKLREWDRAAVRKWTALQATQQERLQALGIPTFQKTADPTILKRQERVMSVLVGFLEDHGKGE
ncbi:hypothetical protein JCM3775_000577 [Rhodotorula graminis]|uniref:Uncharacterized protein n=1 Tax=Rhodotorula graminis (strain WP1) TaxID=578459 RepID=A0A0P9H1J3_RHOGW|nr:uncharacterized protein RHOBADRAFT_45128 [Rhodotorula graminis WP1]KPV73836.1 hypothetical protein RHOBADRAFT_45128 [Rhodotorula graminis WP1]